MRCAKNVHTDVLLEFVAVYADANLHNVIGVRLAFNLERFAGA